VYVEQSVMALEKIYINGGKRGYLISISPSVLKSLLPLTEVNCQLE
jgi:prolyl-tRNA editing enzyme YbaK/EbsC (Cys-tRNA(Pro) deacylase)